MIFFRFKSSLTLKHCIERFCSGFGNEALSDCLLVDFKIPSCQESFSVDVREARSKSTFPDERIHHH